MFNKNYSAFKKKINEQKTLVVKITSTNPLTQKSFDSLNSSLKDIELEFSDRLEVKGIKEIYGKLVRSTKLDDYINLSQKKTLNYIL